MSSNVVVLAFEGEHTAKGMLQNFRKWEEEGLISLEDVVIVSRGVGQDVEIKQTKSMTGKYTLRGSGIGLLAGFILGGPIGGLVVGASAGAISGAMKDIGIDDKFIEEVSQSFSQNTSGLFLMVKEANAERILEELRPFKALVISTTLSTEQEKVLQAALEREE